MKLPYYAFFTGKFGKSTGGLIYALVAIIVVVVAYKLAEEGVGWLRKTIGTKQTRKLSDYFEDQVNNAADGIVPTTQDIVGFESEAQVIADMQFQAMSGPGTNNQALFNQLADLEGWQLVMVADAFGVRSYSNLFWSSDLNIFGWYDEELCDNCTTCFVYNDDNVPGCTNEETPFWCGGCTEREFMRAIWQKSGIPN